MLRRSPRGKISSDVASHQTHLSYIHTVCLSYVSCVPMNTIGTVVTLVLCRLSLSIHEWHIYWYGSAITTTLLEHVSNGTGNDFRKESIHTIHIVAPRVLPIVYVGAPINLCGIYRFIVFATSSWVQNYEQRCPGNYLATIDRQQYSSAQSVYTKESSRPV
jgi:hypothetical protein